MLFSNWLLSLSACLLILFTNVTFASFNLLNKRQAVASRSCGNENNTISICSPTFDSVWTNDTDQEITWKWNNPTLQNYDTLDLYLLYQPTEGTYEVIKNWPSQERTKGVLVQHIDNTWYPTQISDNAPNVTWTMYMYIVGAGYDIQEDIALIPTQHNYFPVPQIFTLIQTSRNTTPTATTTSSTTSATETAGSTDSAVSASISTEGSNKKLPGWAIAVIVIASLLFIAAVAALIWAFKRYKKRSRKSMMVALGPKNGDDEKELIVAPAVAASKSRSGSSISTQQLWPKKEEEKPGQQQLGHFGEAHQSSSILSSTDALMIADTFRQFMRKPEWNEELELQKSQEERKKLGDELLSRQLKKEGTLVQSIDKFKE